MEHRILFTFFWLVLSLNSFTQLHQDIVNKAFVGNLEISDSAKTIFNPSFLKEGIANFKITVTMRGQEFQITSAQSIAKIRVSGKNIIRIVESSSGAMENTSDTTDYDGTTLYPISQRSQQGPASLTFVFTDKSVNGSMQANGQTMPINAVITEPTLPSSSSIGAIIATLPFNDSYTTTINMFDVMSATVRKHSVKVLIREKVAVAKGTFVAYKVEMAPAENDGVKFIYWISVSTHEVVKTEAILPNMMGGGTMTGELQ
jgi:hypothetical protein